MAGAVAKGFGSSPRLRGTLSGQRPPTALRRFIPAPAGNAQQKQPSEEEISVHPRACGERRTTHSKSLAANGSSPRLRGTRSRAAACTSGMRFIPAPAGNAASTPMGTSSPAVHPRACGERNKFTDQFHATSGSSPRLRGTLGERLKEERERRFIPAPAGNARSGVGPIRALSVHPRACGERAVGEDGGRGGVGSSPRLRGTRI
mgnify:CR=1 FL=1